MTEVTEKFYINAEGRFLGVYLGTVPDNATEVPEAPADGRMVFANGVWSFPKELLADENERLRDEFIHGGMVLSTNVAITTSEKAINHLQAAIKRLEKHPEITQVPYPVSPTRSIPCDLDALNQIFDEITEHSQDGYQKQSDIITKIANDEITTFEELAAEWA